MFLLLYFAAGNPGGSPFCGRASDSPSFVYSLDGQAATLQCSNGDCTLATPTPFMGVLIYPREGTFATVPAGLKRRGNCLTHSARLNVNTIHFQVQETTVVDITVVFGKNGHIHQVALVSQNVPVLNTSVFVHIIGAGPGGLGAARYLHANNINFSIYERGTYDPTIFDRPIQETSPFCPCFNYSNVLYTSNVNTVHYSGVGGAQNHNGAVYKPGTPQDLAESTGVPLQAAQTAQQLAATYVPHTNYDMMWSCEDLTCDSKSLANLNSLMRRRSVAFNLPADIIAKITQKEATAVTDEKIVFVDEEIGLGSNDKVIVAAGALTSPSLLGATSFVAWNHYYTTDPITLSPQPATQVFNYVGDYEHNLGYMGNNTWLNISMHMKPTVREYYTVGQDRVHPIGAGSDAYHYAGTVSHARFKVSERLYIGDASALKTPFNCHTSMPAVAAGIMAAQEAVGVLHREVDAVVTENRASVPVAIAFLTGSFLLLAGVAAHVADYYTAHYVIMSVSIIVLITAALSAGRYHRSDEHALLGRIVLIWLCLQAAGGIYAIVYRPLGIYHRISGWVVLALLIATMATATTSSDSWENGETYKHASYVACGATTVVLTASISKRNPLM